MALSFQPKARSVVYCDFSGNIAPEMTKRRPVVVLRAHKRSPKLVTVVPLSTTRPVPVEDWHCLLRQSPLPDADAKEVWAKCDMISVVCTERLDLIHTGRFLPNGKRECMLPKIGIEQFDAIRRGVASVLGFPFAPETSSDLMLVSPPSELTAHSSAV